MTLGSKFHAKGKTSRTLHPRTPLALACGYSWMARATPMTMASLCEERSIAHIPVQSAQGRCASVLKQPHHALKLTPLHRWRDILAILSIAAYGGMDCPAVDPG